MVAAVVVDVGNRLVQAFDHLDADDGGQVLLEPVLLGGVLELGFGDLAQDGLGLGAAAHLHTFGGVNCTDFGQKFSGHAPRHQQAFARVAGAVLLGFGIVGHVHGHVDVARLVHIGVAIAIQVLDDGHFGLSADALNQTLATPRDDHVHKLRHGDELAHGGAVGGLHQLHGVHWQTALGQGLLHQQRQRLVRLDGL